MRNLLLIFGITFCMSLNGQSFYSIKKLGNNYSKEQLEEAMKKADWCGYFHKSERYQLSFDDGAIVELHSLTEDFDNKNNLSESCFQTERIKDIGIFKIHESGVLIRMLSARNTTKN